MLQRPFTQISVSYLQPAALAAVSLLTLAILALVANHRRPINRIWALVLLFLALWQGGIAFTYCHPGQMYLRLVVIFGACGVCAGALLIETITSPWRSLSSHLRRIRLQLAILPLYLLAFTKWWSPASPGTAYQRGIVFWALDTISFIWLCFLLLNCVLLIRRHKVTGIARSELIALVVLITSSFITYVGTFVLGGILNLSHASWRAPSILVLGLSFVTVLLIRNEIFDFRDLRKGFVLFSARGITYVLVACSCLAFVLELHGITVFLRTILGISLVFALLTLPSYDRKLRQLVDRQFISQDFLGAQAAINALIEPTLQLRDLHSAFVDILLKWSDGSPHVFLSDAFFIAPWPPVAIPDSLLRHLGVFKWTTPEILDRQGSRSDELAYLLSHQVAAIVCVTAPSGDTLVAAFATRNSQRPYVSRELREAHELLRLMQLGLSFAKVKRKLLGNERLNFYAQYAPQFAHELRNGLYLQNQLLRAIVEGRAKDVRPSDARVGLDRIEQVEQLCEHFLNVRSLYDRPVRELDLRPAIVAAVKEVTSRIETVNRAQLHTGIQTPPNLCALANPELLNVALHNLLKNAIEALENANRIRAIEVSATVNLRTVHLLIQDNGPGLSEARLRDPFSPTLSEKRSGMGLGLAIARDCIEAMGGTIGVRLSNSTGTCFEITLNSAPLT